MEHIKLRLVACLQTSVFSSYLLVVCHWITENVYFLWKKEDERRFDMDANFKMKFKFKSWATITLCWSLSLKSNSTPPASIVSSLHHGNNDASVRKED